MLYKFSVQYVTYLYLNCLKPYLFSKILFIKQKVAIFDLNLQSFVHWIQKRNFNNIVLHSQVAYRIWNCTEYTVHKCKVWNIKGLISDFKGRSKFFGRQNVFPKSLRLWKKMNSNDFFSWISMTMWNSVLEIWILCKLVFPYLQSIFYDLFLYKITEK